MNSFCTRYNSNLSFISMTLFFLPSFHVSRLVYSIEQEAYQSLETSKHPKHLSDNHDPSLPQSLTRPQLEIKTIKNIEMLKESPCNSPLDRDPKNEEAPTTLPHPWRHGTFPLPFFCLSAEAPEGLGLVFASLTLMGLVRSKLVKAAPASQE